MATQPKILGATLARVDAVLTAIDNASGIDFPYEDSLDGLKIVAAQFRGIRQTLLASADPALDSSALKGYCARALEAIFEHLPLVGFLARSANANGAPEFHGPLRRLTAKAVGDDAKLVISSEWDFSPFTLLFPHKSLSGFVLVGLPMSESGNALIAPLAGHELGHNIWRRHKLLERVMPLAHEKLRACITGRWGEFTKVTGLTKPEQLEDLIGQTFLGEPYRSTVAQCEELFCDLVGLRIFGQSYLHAFEYLLAPGLSGERSTDYPCVQDRVKALSECALAWQIPIPEEFAGSFDKQDTGSRLLQSFADDAALALLPLLTAYTEEFTVGITLNGDTESEAARLAGCFKSLIPASGALHLGSLINAGWRVYFDDVAQSGVGTSPLSRLKVEDRGRVLNELLLKSFEVFEIENLQNL